MAELEVHRMLASTPHEDGTGSMSISDEEATKSLGGPHAIWLFAFGYFAAYAPYSALTKALSSGLYPDVDALPGLSLLPISTLTSLVVMLVFLTKMDWWKHATQRQFLGRSWPVPRRLTAVSGACTALIIATTTLAYTFEGVSIVFIMLLMRGGVLIIAPIVDAVSGRKVRWFSFVGLALSIAALIVAFAEKGGYAITLTCAIDVVLYLVAYLVRLRVMSREAKSKKREATLRYFVEEQLVATPLTVALLCVGGLIGTGPVLETIRAGFIALPAAAILPTMLLGVLSQGTGIFGTLVFLDPSENTFSVPVNRSSSILAGVVASAILAVFLDAEWPSAQQLMAAGLVVLAIVALTLGPWLAARRGREEESA
ncbi:MAG: hypothetical protein ACI9KE_000653 [Polyangiales bacterium]|jgi:hypothetical protein